jgi:hypothetical protein
LEQLTSDVKIDNTTIIKDAYTGELSAALATTHSLGIVKGGTGTMIGDHGEVNVYQRLQEGYVGDPGSRVSVPYYDSKFRLNKEDNGDYKKGGIYELQINAVTPVGTENPSEEGWYEYTGTYGDDSEYELTEDITVDSEKTYYTIAWVLVSANSQEFNTDDFEIENDVVSLDVSQRTFTGTQAEWDALTTAEKKTYGTVNITDDESTANFDVYSTVETKTNKVWIDGKPIYSSCKACLGYRKCSSYRIFIFRYYFKWSSYKQCRIALLRLVILCKNSQGSWQELTGNGEQGPAQNFVWISDTSAYFINGGVLDGAWAIFEYTKTTD